MENRQDQQMIRQERDMIPAGTVFREQALEKYIGDGETPPEETIVLPPKAKQQAEAETARRKTDSDAVRRLLRLIATLLLCAVALTYYSSRIVSGLRTALSDGFSSAVVGGLLTGREEVPAEITINPALLELLSTTFKRPGLTFLSPYYPSESENESIDTPIEQPERSNDSSPVYPIVTMDLSSNADDGLTFHNETAYTPDAQALLASAVPILSPEKIADLYGSDAPLVLILHTHGTEAYTPENADTYRESDNFRSEDTTQNVVAVGKVMADTLNGYGINTIHCTIMHDKESYRDSYVRAAETIRAYIEEYPSIQYVFDVHRDSVIRSDMSCVRTIADVDGEEAAQFMVVVGTDDKGANHPDWEKNNLTLAVHLQNQLALRYPGFTRSINLRGAAFNEQYAPGSLLLEIGTCGNTLSQAKKTAETVASTLAQLIQQNQSVSTVQTQ